jgi:hypothetical protein
MRSGRCGAPNEVGFRSGSADDQGRPNSRARRASRPLPASTPAPQICPSPSRTSSSPRTPPQTNATKSVIRQRHSVVESTTERLADDLEPSPSRFLRH